MEKKIGNSALHLTFAKALTIVLSLVSGMLLSRFRTLEEYGTYSQIMIVITTASSFIMLGLPNSTNYFLATMDIGKERKKFLSVYYTLNTILCAILGAILLVLIPLIEKYFDNNTIRNFAYFLAIYPWANITLSSISNVLVVYSKTKLLMVINVIASLITLLSVLIIQLLGLSFGDYMLVFLVGNVLIAVAVYVIVSRLENGLSIKFDLDLIRKIFAYSIPIGLATVVGTLNVEMDKLMIGKLMDTESLAIYTNAGKELPLTIVATSLTAVLLPQMARLLKNNDNKNAVKLWGTTIKISYIIICFFVTACIVFAPQIITLLYSEKYILGTNVFRVYSLVLLLRITYFGMVLNSTGKTKFILWSSIVSLVLNVIFNYLFFKFFGFVGPAWATFLSVLLVNVLQLVYTSNLIKISFKQIFPWKSLFNISLLNALWGSICYLLIRAFDIGISNKEIVISIIIGAIITILYIVIMRKRIMSFWHELNSDK